MNTVQKGDAFEEKMKDLIEELLHKDELPINSKYSKVYCKKKYYSRDRDSDIIIDISVECTLPNETLPSTYLMIECKDYSGAIPINDLEEFYAKTIQIVGLNVKAIFLSTAPFQKAALNYAVNKGIRIMRVHPNGKREVLSFRKEGTKANINSTNFIQATLALTEPDKSPRKFAFAGISNQSVHFDFKSFIIDTIND